MTGDPTARVRMAERLYETTGWDIFPEVDPARPLVSRRWAEDWDSTEDAVYDGDD